MATNETASYWEGTVSIKALRDYLNRIGIEIVLEEWLEKGPDDLIEEIDRQTLGRNEAYDLVMAACDEWDFIKYAGQIDSI